MKKFQVFVSAFLGGVLVAVFSLSGLLLREEHPVAASMLFGVMLLAVLLLDLHLMTAKAGYLLWDSGMIRMRRPFGACTLRQCRRRVCSR